MDLNVQEIIHRPLSLFDKRTWLRRLIPRVFTLSAPRSGKRLLNCDIFASCEHTKVLEDWNMSDYNVMIDEILMYKVICFG